MTSAEKRVRRKLLEEVTFEKIRPYLTGDGDLRRVPILKDTDVSWVAAQVIHRVRKILDYPGRRLGKRALKCTE